MDANSTMPMHAGIRLGSAALQVMAIDAGVDVLHVKGPAVHPSLLDTTTVVDPTTGDTIEAPEPRRSVDVDLLVRPEHMELFFTALREHDWQLAYWFSEGSVFEHASTWLRHGLAAADVHRDFPGIGLDRTAAFERLWADRETVLIGGYPCAVPSVTAQRLILILHATRGGELLGPDIKQSWHNATDEQRTAVDALAEELDAVVPLAAGTGRLDQHKDAREYPLWRALSSGDHRRTVLWVALVRAQPTLPARVRTALLHAAPKPGRLRHNLGRNPTVGETLAAWRRELGNVAREMRTSVHHLSGRGKR